MLFVILLWGMLRGVAGVKLLFMKAFILHFPRLNRCSEECYADAVPHKLRCLQKCRCAILPIGKGEDMELSAVLTPATEGGFVALNPETGTTTQGETVEEALTNLREATELYLEEFPLMIAGRSLLTTFHVAAHA